jgi:hypothetical protein
MGVMTKHQPVVKKKSSRTKAQRKHRRHENQELAQQVAERIRDATERSHALGNYLPPPRCPARRQDRHTLYICCRWDPHPADHGTDDEGHRWVPVEP